MKISYILIPGLGDQKPIFGWFYRRVEKRWARKGMPVRMVQPEWVSAEHYPAKYDRLLAAIAEERSMGREAVLVGVSAGASLGLLALAQRRGGVRAFVSVCGFTLVKPQDRRNDQLMSLSWYQAAAAAEDALKLLTASDRKQILSLIARTDKVIDPKHEYIQGATNIRLHSRGHLASIVLALIWNRRRIQRFATSIG